MTPSERRIQKLTWSLAHPDAVRQANRRYRAANPLRTRAQAAARMRRLRARRREAKRLQSRFRK